MQIITDFMKRQLKGCHYKHILDNGNGLSNKIVEQIILQINSNTKTMIVNLLFFTGHVFFHIYYKFK